MEGIVKLEHSEDEYNQTILPEKSDQHIQIPLNFEEGNKPKSFQWRALTRQRMSMKSREKCSLCCSISTPCVVMMLLLTIILIAKYAFASLATDNGKIIYPSSDILNKPGNIIGGNGECLTFFLMDTPYDLGTLEENSTFNSGVLGQIPQFQCQLANAGPILEIPYMTQLNYSTYEEAVEDVNNWIYDKLVILSNAPTFNDATKPPLRYILPDAGIVLNGYDIQGGTLNYTLQASTQPKSLPSGQPNFVTRYYRDNSFGNYRIPNLIHMLDSRFLGEIFNIAQGIYATVQQWPYKSEFDYTVITDYVGILLYPLAVSFLFPGFVYTIVYEKEHKLREQMKMMGLKMTNYWLVTYFFDYLLYTAAALVMLIMGVGMQLGGFKEPSLVILLLFTWGHVQIAISFFTSSLLSKNRTVSSLIMYGLVLILTFAAFGVNLAEGDKGFGWYLLIWPHFAFGRGWGILGQACASDSGCLNITDLTPDSQFAAVLMYLWMEWLLYMLGAYYLDSVLPQEFGVRRSWYFPVTDLWSFLKKDRKKENIPLQDMDDPQFHSSNRFGLNPDEDEDIKNERRLVESGRVDQNAPIIIRKLHKTYDNGKVAVDNLSFHVDQNECFGFLGPNGAGKTTTISILTGLFQPTSGSASVGGFDISEEIDLVHRVIGVCPQFDIQWSELTVEEHLLFYARLKGIESSVEKEHVVELATEVGLEGCLDRQSGQLSGGMRRRLSIAIALIGNPRIVFLDEPSTGLDPVSKRHLWEILTKHKKGKAVVITTHSMEEADTLCDKIGIVAKGKLMAIGSSVHLKGRFGKGYSLGVNIDGQRDEDVHQFIMKLVPEAELLNSIANTRMYRLKTGSFRVSQLISDLEENKKKVGISDWSLSQTTLEEVFISLCKETEEVREESQDNQ